MVGRNSKDSILIDLEEICFSYPGGRPILNNLSFQLYEKERIALIGPNGSGKTTLFHVVMGLIKPTGGKIRILGNNLADEKDFKAVRQKVGLLFQDADDQLFSPTVIEDVAFGPLNLGKWPANMTVEEWLIHWGGDSDANGYSHDECSDSGD